MAVLETSTVVIACPHCGTRYQVPYATIGTKGRTVQCAHCQKSWPARAEPPEPMVSERAERGLDDKFNEEERRQRVATGSQSAPAPVSEAHQRTLDEIKAAIERKAGSSAPVEVADPAAQRRQQQEFSKRQRSLNSRLPAARFRRAARVVVVGAIVLLVGSGLLLRGEIVQQFPQLAGVYESVGLGVNVIGLEFEDVRTVKSLQQGAELLVVDATIRSVAGGDVPVPQVIVTLLGPGGEALYEWSVLAKAADLKPGETVAFETQLTAPPDGASKVKLTFANGRSQSKAGGPLPPQFEETSPTESGKS